MNFILSQQNMKPVIFFPKIMLCRLVRIIWVLYGLILMFIYQ